MIRIRLNVGRPCSSNGSGGLASHKDDYRLSQQLLHGDKTAWRTFVMRFQGLVFSRLRRTAQECQRSLNVSDVEDLCAEVFARLIANDYASLRNFRGDSSLATWLSVISHRTCLKFLHRKVNDQMPSLDEQRDISAGEWMSADANHDESLMRQEDLQQLMAALGELTPGDQSVVRLFYLEEMSYRSIAEQLGISINTVGPKLHGAIKKLRYICRLRQQSSLNLENPSNAGTNSDVNRD